jgi:hypothetical protein
MLVWIFLSSRENSSPSTFTIGLVPLSKMVASGALIKVLLNRDVKGPCDVLTSSSLE